MLQKSEMKKNLLSLLNNSDKKSESQIDVSEKKVDIPVKYTDASAFLVFFSASLEKVKNLLKSDRLSPVMTTPGRCLFGVTFFDYRECPVGPYHEFTFSIPVMVDSNFKIPLLPIVFDSLFSSFGHHVVLMGADTNIAREHIEKIFPYPLVYGDTPIKLLEKDGILSASIVVDGQNVISVDHRLPQKFKFEKKKYNTYYEKDGKLFRVKLNTFSYQSKIFNNKDAKVTIGDNQTARFFNDLDITPKPVICVYYRQAVEIATKGEEI